MRILIGCEFSGVVRDAFIRAGHDAWSCDLLPTEAPGPHHQGDIREVLDAGWDLGIFHPPCTYLANSANGSLYKTESKTPGVLVGPARWAALIDSAVFFRSLLDAPIPRIAVENPIMNGHARKIIGTGPTQTVQPWMFGHTEIKATGLWLRGLPPLVITEDVRAATMALPYAERGRVHHASPGPDRWKVRSVTYAGIAQAMADQWGGQTVERVA